MALDAAVPAAQTPARPEGLARLAAVPAHWALAAIVGVSFAVRTLLALAHATPLYFPDEYIYSQLARGLADTGRPVIRGGHAHFPALLEPLLASPFYLLHDPALAYRLTQGMNALLMSLAAVPVYLLCRRLGLGLGFGLGAAVVAVASPDFFYTSFILAEPVAYPLVLGALYLGVCALAEPSPRTQVGFVALAGLAAFARIQYVVLPVAFVLGTLVMEGGRVRAVARRFHLSLGLLAAGLVLGLAAGPGRTLGYYSSGVSKLHVHAGPLVHWLATDAMLLAYASGWVLVPGALVGLAVALARPLERTERAFAALAVFVGAGVFLEAALYASNAHDRARFQERYLLALLPLAAPAFGLYARRGLPRKAPVSLLAVGLIALSARFPLAGYTDTSGRQDSPFLMGVSRLETAVGWANGSLVVAVIVAALSIAALAIAFRLRGGAGVALALALAFLVAVDAGAFSLDADIARHARATYLPSDAGWVDHAGIGAVTVVQTPGAPRALDLEQMFWNRSANDLVRMRLSDPVDVFRAPRVRVTADGTMLADGRPLGRPLLFTRYAVTEQLANAQVVASTPLFDLWRTDGRARLALLTGGRYYDGWLATSGYIRVWPDATGQIAGTLRLVLQVPYGARRTSLDFRARGLLRRITLRPGQQQAVRFTVSTSGRWILRFKSTGGVFLSDGRGVSMRSSTPVFRRARPVAAAAT